jgi:hypothetical protein
MAAVPAAPAGVLRPVGISTGFGRDASSQRTITWLTKHTARLRAPQVTYATSCAAVDAGTGATQAGSVKRLGAYLSGYDAATVTLTGLDPATSYCYRVSGARGAARTSSRDLTFTTAPAAPTSVTFLDFADSQGTPASYATYWASTVRAATAAYPGAAFATHTGDMIDANTRAQVTKFLASTGKAFGGLPLYPVLGNHEGTRYTALFRQLFPQDAASARAGGGPAAPYALMDAIAYGPVLVLGLNSNYTGRAQIARQVRWARAEIRAQGTAADGTARFVIVELHKSPYGGTHAGDTVTSKGMFGAGNLRKYLAPKLSRLGVDLVLAGHDHNYIRTFPIRADGTFQTGGSSRKPSTDQVSASADGLIWLIPRDSGLKTYGPARVDSTHHPWIDYLWRAHGEKPGHTRPANDVYAAITVNEAAITVVARTAAGETVDRFTVTR